MKLRIICVRHLSDNRRGDETSDRRGAWFHATTNHAPRGDDIALGGGGVGISADRRLRDK
ncbi:hypothetical protein NECAME_15444 [Necator americanus]|uniref:Uncharacterized protein n=1 Tax=Necator americanus TaxID=51031 RepID=W2SI40_NECAM|nr:hypothetical protein NECAME_15444 [Necator americanus]ETN69243.1 hypothetical protein NECAME_15444 [Necator americanus]